MNRRCRNLGRGGGLRGPRNSTLAQKIALSVVGLGFRGLGERFIPPVLKTGRRVERLASSNLASSAILSTYSAAW